MMNNISAFWMPGAIELLIILIFMSAFAVSIIFFVRYVLRNKRENIMLRLEVGKLADELEKERKSKQGGIENSTLDKSD